MIDEKDKNMLSKLNSKARTCRSFMTKVAFPKVMVPEYSVATELYASSLVVAGVDDLSKASKHVTDKAIKVSSSFLTGLMRKHAYDSEVKILGDASDEYTKPDGSVKVLVIKDVPFRKDITISPQLAVLSFGGMLGSTQLWSAPEKNVLERAGFKPTASIVTVVGSPGHRQAELSHVDCIYAPEKENIPPLVTLFCKENIQKVPTYFNNGKAIWDDLSADDKAKLAKEDYVISWSDRWGVDHYSQPFPIFRVKGDIEEPKAVAMQFDLVDPANATYNIRCRDQAAVHSLGRLKEVVWKYTKPYHTGISVPEDNSKTAQHTAKEGDLIVCDARVLHGRPEIPGPESWQGKYTERELLRVHFAARGC